MHQIIGGEDRREVMLHGSIASFAPLGPVVWEAGHYYESRGTTVFSRIGWDILSQHAASDHGRMLFVDDVHKVHEMHPAEQNAPSAHLELNPEPTHIVTESAMREPALEALELLKNLRKRQRARKTYNPKQWTCSGHRLLDVQGNPLCLLYDLGLTLHKYRLGYRHVVNVLPDFYLDEQRALRKLARKMLPDLTLQTILFRHDGTWNPMPDEQ